MRPLHVAVGLGCAAVLAAMSTLPGDPALDPIQAIEPIPQAPVATVGQHADRILEQYVVRPAGLQGLPFAPAGLSGCSEMEFYRRQWQLPDHFDTVGWRESRCDNTAQNSCCHGYWQLYVSLHLRDHRLAPLYARCEIRSSLDVRGEDPLVKQKQACATYAVYIVQGGEAWVTW